MKKVVAIFFLIFVLVSSAFANFSAIGDLYQDVKSPQNVDKVYIFNSLNGAELSFSFFKETTFTWKKYTISPSSATEIITETKSVATLDNLENATGYILEYQNDKMQLEQKIVWVFNYSLYKSPNVQLISIADRTSPDFICAETTIEGTINITAEGMNYVGKNGDSHSISPYKMYLSYTTLDVDTATYELADISAEYELRDPISGVNPFVEYLDNVYKNTPFSIVLKDMKGEVAIKTSNEMEVDNMNILPKISVAGFLTLREREDDEMYNKNEVEKGNENEHRNIEGSAPLDIQLKMSKNDVVSEITWKIYKTEKGFRDTLVRRNETVLNEEDFSKVGDYVVKVVAQTEKGCITEDSITIKIGNTNNDIFLEVPNVFTPNDDGKNDEFRVAYRSILKYEIWVYNRWGRMVYHSKEPAKGWDGRIGGKDASVGVYFYVIKAKGADGKDYDKDGSVNLLR